MPRDTLAPTSGQYHVCLSATTLPQFKIADLLGREKMLAQYIENVMDELEYKSNRTPAEEFELNRLSDTKRIVNFYAIEGSGIVRVTREAYDLCLKHVTVEKKPCSQLGSIWTGDYSFYKHAVQLLLEKYSDKCAKDGVAILPNGWKDMLDWIPEGGWMRARIDDRHSMLSPLGQLIHLPSGGANDLGLYLSLFAKLAVGCKYLSGWFWAQGHHTLEEYGAFTRRLAPESAVEKLMVLAAAVYAKSHKMDASDRRSFRILLDALNESRGRPNHQTFTVNYNVYMACYLALAEEAYDATKDVHYEIHEGGVLDEFVIIPYKKEQATQQSSPHEAVARRSH